MLYPTLLVTLFSQTPLLSLILEHLLSELSLIQILSQFTMDSLIMMRSGFVTFEYSCTNREAQSELPLYSAHSHFLTRELAEAPIFFCTCNYISPDLFLV